MSNEFFLDKITGVTVRLTKAGETDITETGVTVLSPIQITCTIDLTGAMFGQWNVVVTNADAQSGSLANGFMVNWDAPTVNSITTDNGSQNGTIPISDLAGTNFKPGATVRLTKAGETDIAATGVTVVSPNQITCNITLTGAAMGQWNVVVTNADGQFATFTNGFTVLIPRFVAVGDNGRRIISSDGITWSNDQSGGAFLYDVDYGNGVFIAVGGTISLPSRRIISSDGITWTNDQSGGDGLSGIAYGGGIFVAVGSYGRRIISSDGITWSNDQSGGDTLYKIVYGQ